MVDLRDGANAAGTRIVPVDYELYAQGEAVLGWLNATARLEASAPLDWPQYCRDFLARFKSLAGRQSAEIAHVKLLLTAPDCIVMANLTGSDSAPSIRTRGDKSGPRADLIVNARVRIAPAALREIVQSCLQSASDAARRNPHHRELQPQPAQAGLSLCRCGRLKIGTENRDSHLFLHRHLFP